MSANSHAKRSLPMSAVLFMIWLVKMSTALFLSKIHFNKQVTRIKVNVQIVLGMKDWHLLTGSSVLWKTRMINRARHDYAFIRAKSDWCSNKSLCMQCSLWHYRFAAKTSCLWHRKHSAVSVPSHEASVWCGRSAWRTCSHQSHWLKSRLLLCCLGKKCPHW